MLLGAPALAATVLYVYDELGRLVAEIDPAAETTLYSYDAAGNLLSVSRGSSSQFRVVSFAPTRGRAGDVVTIFGSGFSPTPAQNTVAFNGAPATVTAATVNALTVTAPAGVTTGPISVSNANGSAVTATPFTVLLPATINAVTPATVNRAALTQVSIEGANLSTASAVTFSQAGIGARVIAGATDQAVGVELSVAPTVPLGSYAFSVATAAGTTESGSVTVTVSAAVIGPAQVQTAPLSVHVPTQIPGPAGNAMRLGQPLSVHVPVLIPGPPGNALIVTQPLSVLKP